jgi:putative ABC transport system ATP-binding protein
MDAPVSHPLIEFREVSKLYGSGEARVEALNDVNFAIERGSFVAIMGPSGSGKSTAMNIMGCLDVPSTGEYLFEGVPVSGLGRDERTMLRRHMLGFVFQGFNLLARTSAIENVALPLVYRGMPAKERDARAMRALIQVGLADRAHHSPAELSGGQQQRVAIARAIVTDPAVLLADEPTGNLDTRISREIMEIISDLNLNAGLTVVMVTHEEDIAAYAHRVIRFVDGRIESDRYQEPAGVV